MKPRLLQGSITELAHIWPEPLAVAFQHSLRILLGGHMEDALRRAMVIADGDLMYLFSSPISIGFWIAAVLGFVAPMFLRGVLAKPQRVSD